jgi:PAS domain S-box-containing protein
MPLILKPLQRSAADARIEHQRLTSLINSMADAVIAVDENIQVVLYNGATLNILDRNNIRAGAKLSTLVRPIDRNNQAVDIVKLTKQASVPTTNRDLRLKYDDGSLINLYLSIAPVHLGFGEKGTKGFVLLLRDITREKSLEEERDEFISVISHELRTPIAISEGNLSNAQFIAEKSGDMTAIKAAVKAAHEQILFLSDMINDLSTLSRAERGTLEVTIDKINVHELVTELCDNYTPLAKTKGLTLHLELDPKLELLESSRLYVHEILQNFITNAIKYTERGAVTIRAKADPKGVNFAIQDTGIGISKGDQDRVFDKFFRSEDFRTRQNNGTGLGLYVTLKLTHLIHGKIELKSELDKGSTFTIFIPDLR